MKSPSFYLVSQKNENCLKITTPNRFLCFSSSTPLIWEMAILDKTWSRIFLPIIFRESIWYEKTILGVSANGYFIRILPRSFKVCEEWDESHWFHSKKSCQEEESRTFDNWDKSTMIALLKVYKTLYQNDEHEILYVMIIKSKFSDHFLKNVLLPYLQTLPYEYNWPQTSTQWLYASTACNLQTILY